MRGNRRMVAVAIAIVISGALPMVMIGALGASIRRDLEMTNANLGIVFTVFSGVSMLSARPAGRLCERLGWHRSSRVGCWLSGASFVGMAAFGRGMLTLSVFAGIGGLAQSMSAPSANLLMAREISGRSTGTAMGLKQSAVPIASMLSGATVPALALTVGWRYAALASGLLVAAIPLGMPARPAPSPSTTAAPRKEAACGRDAKWRLMLRANRPTLLSMAIAGFMGTFSAHAFNAFFVVSSVDRGLSEGMAAALFAAAGFACLVVRVLGGMLADRWSTASRLPLTVCGVMVAVGVFGLGMLAPGIPALIVVGGLLAYAAAWGWPTFYHIGIVRYYFDSPGAATGALRIGLAGGAMAGPMVFGLISSSGSYMAAWLAMAFVGVIGSAVFVWSERFVRTSGLE